MNQWDDFDQSLMDALTDLPPSDGTVRAVTPWREGMDRVVLGLCLTCFTLHILYLEYLLPAVGALELYLGFRSLRSNNRSFRLAAVLSAGKAGLLFLTLVLNATPWAEVWAGPRAGLQTGLTVALLAVFRQGLRQVESEIGQATSRDPLLWALIWYAILIGLGLWAPQPGWLAFAAMGYVFYRIVRSLLCMTESLEHWGYAVQTAAVRLSAKRIFLLWGAVLITLILGGSVLSQQTFPDERRIEQAFSTQEDAIRAQLLELGFPEEILARLPAEELEKLTQATACVSLPNSSASPPRSDSEGYPFRTAGTMVYLGSGTARFYMLADYDDGVSAWRQTLAEFSDLSTVRWDGACYLYYQKKDSAYRAKIPVEEQIETVDNFFSGPAEQMQIRARYRFPLGVTDRACLFICSVKLWNTPPNEGIERYYLDASVNFFRSTDAIRYPYTPLSSQDRASLLVQYYNYFEFFPQKSPP